MTDEVAAAIDLLQRRCWRQGHGSPYWNERLERALDDLVANPDRTGNPHYLARNALSNAGHVMDRRQEICLMSLIGGSAELETYCDLLAAPRDGSRPQPRSATTTDAGRQAEIDLRLLLDGSALSLADRNLLGELADGASSTEAAARRHLPVHVMRIRISHARRRARHHLDVA
jgi:hypothetical protein